MKPYRGQILAAVVLLATMPLASCGDADDYAQTGGITLTAQTASIIVKREVVFTVTASFPTTTTSPTAAASGISQAPVINQCDTALEYQAEGAGVNHPWRNIPGTSAARNFMLEPRETGMLSVIARGKCVGSKEDWKYSAQVDVTVTDVEALAKPTVSLVANPATVVQGKPVTFTLSATIPSMPDTCTLKLKYQYSGAGFDVTTVNPASSGQFVLTPPGPAPATLTVTATGWCAENPAEQDVKTTTVSVTVAASTTITAPSAPTFPTPVNSGAPTTFSSGGSTCTNSETVEYRFTATGSPTTVPNPSAWSSTPDASFTWAAPGGPYKVSVQARCVPSNSVVSSSVSSADITVN